MEIRDSRGKEWFWLDNDYLNGYAKHLGVMCTNVYISLCRHADNRTQTCFPSMEQIAEEIGAGRNAVSRAIKTLSEWNIISIFEGFDSKNNRRKNNIYTLLSKKEWRQKSEPCTVKEHGEPCTPKDESHAPQECNNKTHINKTHICEDKLRDGKKKMFVEDETPFSLEEFVASMKTSPQRHIRIIGDYADEKKINFTTKGQWKTFVSRNVRPARLLTPYSDEQIGKSMAEINKNKKNGKDGYITRWTLETLLKYLEK